jgi:hypothetical protein
MKLQSHFSFTSLIRQIKLRKWEKLHIQMSNGWFTHSMPRPCRSRAMLCRWGFRMSFPFDLHSAAMSDSHLPCRAHAIHWPCCSSQGHGTVWPSRDGLWATCPCSASSGYHVGVLRRLLSPAYQSTSQRSIPMTVKRLAAAHYKKDDLLNCWTSSSDISDYHAEFHGGHGTVGAGLG